MRRGSNSSLISKKEAQAIPKKKQSGELKEKTLMELWEKARRDIEKKDKEILSLKAELEKKKGEKKKSNISGQPGSGAPVMAATEEKSARAVDVEKNFEREFELEGLREQVKISQENVRKALEVNDKLKSELAKKNKQLAEMAVELEKEKVGRLDSEISKEKERLFEVDKMIQDQREIKQLRHSVKAKEKELSQMAEKLALTEKEHKQRLEECQQEIQALTHTIENFAKLNGWEREKERKKKRERERELLTLLHLFF